MPSRTAHPGEPAFRRGARRAIFPMICALTLSWLGGASCVFHPAAKRTVAPPAASETTPAVVETRVGVVRAVGAEQRFVLIETPSALATSSLSEGQFLHCRAPDSPDRAASADLRVSLERHQSFIVANVVAGTPVIGAIVYTRMDATPASSAPSPSPDSISSVSTAPLPGLFPPRKP